MDKKFVITLYPNNEYSKIFRWKDIYEKPINLEGFEFISEFKFNSYNENTHLCILNEENNGINLNRNNGEIQLKIDKEYLKNVKSYDTGTWNISYTTDKKNYNKLISGRWIIDSEVYTIWKQD